MDATLVSRWTELCQQLAAAFTAPTYVTFLHVVTAWALCRSRPTVTALVQTVGPRLLGHAAKHWTSYERFFHHAAWSIQRLSCLLLTRVVLPLIDAQGVGGSTAPVDLAIDDTTAGRFGGHVAYAGYFKDASASNVLRKVCHWSHNWVIGCLTVRPRRWPNWVLGLPVLFALYRKAGACDRRHPFRSRHELAAAMVRQVRQALAAGRRLRVVTDGQYATRVLCAALAEDKAANLVSRIRRDAALYALPTRPRRRKAGGPRKRGRRLATPRQMAARRTKGWRDVSVLAYAGRIVTKRVLAVTCLWPRVCGYRPIKLLIVRDPNGVQRDDFFFCTDPAASDAEIVERFAARWPVEQVVRDGKQHDGFEHVQGWCPRTVERQAPLALVVQTLVKAWFVGHAAAAHPRLPHLPGGHKSCGWRRPEHKDHPSYLDMLATLRGVLWANRIKCNSTFSGRVRGIMNALKFTLCAAA
jgi:DDE superfamily endonuclease